MEWQIQTIDILVVNTYFMLIELSSLWEGDLASFIKSKFSNLHSSLNTIKWKTDLSPAIWDLDLNSFWKYNSLLWRRFGLIDQFFFLICIALHSIYAGKIFNYFTLLSTELMFTSDLLLCYLGLILQGHLLPAIDFVYLHKDCFFDIAFLSTVSNPYTAVQF